MIFKIHNILFNKKRTDKTEIRIEYDNVKDELEEKISDYLSDRSGFCHNGFEIELKGNKLFAKSIDWDCSEEDKQYINNELEIPSRILKETLNEYLGNKLDKFDVTFE